MSLSKLSRLEKTEKGVGVAKNSNQKARFRFLVGTLEESCYGVRLNFQSGQLANPSAPPAEEGLKNRATATLKSSMVEDAT
jgi:hypothetical protein